MRWYLIWEFPLYSFARAAITKYHRLGGLNNGNVLTFLTVLEAEGQGQGVSRFGFS